MSLSNCGCVIGLSSLGSMIGSSRLTPKKYCQIMSTVALAKYGFFGEVIQSASTVRVGSLGFQFGSSPVKNFAFATLAVPGIVISRAVLAGTLTGCVPSGLKRPKAGWVPTKNAANSQNSSRVHLANGCAWHWAHSSFTPRNTRDAEPARFSALLSAAM